MTALEKFPSFTYKRSIVTDSRIILVDEPLTQGTRTELCQLETTDGQRVMFLEDTHLAADLEENLSNILLIEKDILFVFPGNGSSYPRKLSGICQKSLCVGVYAKRFWMPGTDPMVRTGLIIPKMFLVTKVKTVVVVDDVVSSGLTMRKLHQDNAWRFPCAKWISVSWVAQTPQMKAKSGINGYERMETACLVAKTNGGKVPINSLSTLRKDLTIRECYAKRHFRNPEMFLDLMRR